MSFFTAQHRQLASPYTVEHVEGAEYGILKMPTITFFCCDSKPKLQSAPHTFEKSSKWRESHGRYNSHI